MAMVKSECLQCGELFLKLNGRQTHCSKICVQRAHRSRNRELRNSQNKERYNNDSEYRERVQNAIIKSREENKRGKDNLRFSGNRELALKRDNYVCTKCGDTEKLHVHHIDKSGTSDKPNHELSNLITLCGSCHSLEHTGDKVKGQMVKCEQCGKETYAKGSLIEKKRFCSIECKDKAHTGEIMTSHKRNCLVCGKEFMARNSMVVIGKGKYCSSSCSSQGQKKTVTLNCLYCNNEFETIPAKIKVGKGKFCSKPCYFKHKAL